SNELAGAGTIPLMPFGLAMVAPVIWTYGNQAQKDYFLPRIYHGVDWWCQGYSEPGAGSDLAGLRTSAVRDGDHYVINGSKTWTTLAQHADMMFFLVRTDADARPQAGISFLLVDMKTPGISVRPIITLDGGHEVNEIFLEDVRTPVANRIGNENEGWTYAKVLLGHERSGMAGVARSKHQLARLKRVAGATIEDGRALIENPDFAHKLALLEIDLLALEYTDLRMLAAENAGKPPGPESSILKIKGTEVQQRITELMLEAAGIYGALYLRGMNLDGDNFIGISAELGGIAPDYLNMRKSSIYGGSNEIQRNIIAKAVLGL
ncbi:MAG TPA: acyl-CoA dehydrogenase family protein, partial [Alphaproteobacteria bacterium]|nr:acyl-CoA dehydrogenase family protein [Alphaproteobacteria bacterium]